MSRKIEYSLICKFKNDFDKSSKFIMESLIIYNDDNLNSEEFFQLMKSGYEEMSEINLQISDEFDISQNSYKFRYDTFNEYEKWLCGV